ncbi:hypothetical protein BGX26_007729 [Mortierella sp. AD094]|nr:hypothetical protein BGX26_007729 [Mortierella sp. AD094]
MAGSTQYYQQEQDSKQPLQLRTPPASLPTIIKPTDLHATNPDTGYTISPPPAISIGTAVTPASSIVPPPAITVASPIPSAASSTFNALDLPFSNPSLSSSSFSQNSLPPHSITPQPSSHRAYASSSASYNMTTAIATASTSLSPLSSPTASIHSRADHPGNGPSRPSSMALDDRQSHHTSGSTRTVNISSNGHGYDSATTSQRSSNDDSGLYDDDYGANISFVFANEKRFSDFHSLFRSVPDDEKLIEDYGCALQKEILVQGRLYISENHVCFNANIFGWVTNLVIAFSEITAIEKRMTAFVIPNAIGIVTTTNTKGHFFASFLSRDAAHDLLMAAWRKSFPCAANASVANGGNGNGNGYSRQNRSNITINDDDDSNDGQSFISGKGDSRKNRHRRSFSNASQNWTGDESGAGEELDEKTGLKRRGSKRGVVKKLKGSLSPNGIIKRPGRPRSVSELPPRPTSFDGSGNRDAIETARSYFEDDSPVASGQRLRAGTESLHIPGPGNSSVAFNTRSSSLSSATSTSSASKVPTSCKCSKDGRHYSTQFMSETYPGSVQAMWKLLFDSDFSKGFLTSESMKGADVQEEAWQSSPDGKSTKTIKYTKWLGMPIGPKTTKAILTDVCEYKNFDDYTTTVTTTSTPDVPSGGSFTTKVRTCITWAGPNQVQVVVTGGVEFTKSSWIKGQIEKGAAEGLTTHYKELSRCIRKHIAANSKDFGGSTSSSKTSTAAPVAPTREDHLKERLQDTLASSSQSSVSPAQGQGSTRTPTSAQTTAGAAGSSPLAGFFSNLSKSMDWNHSNSSAQLLFVAVLVIVMVANFYIFLQISSVSSQIEKIQSEILGDHHHHLHQHQHHPGNNHFASPRSSPAGSGRHTAGPHSPPSRSKMPLRDYDDFEREEMFARAQEEAMWAWLTEREARHRQYRTSSGVYMDNKERYGRKSSNEKKDQNQQQQQQQQQNDGQTETEANLQTRIGQLQEQLAALERQASLIKIDTLAVEKDVSTP